MWGSRRCVCDVVISVDCTLTHAHTHTHTHTHTYRLAGCIGSLTTLSLLPSWINSRYVYSITSAYCWLMYHHYDHCWSVEWVPWGCWLAYGHDTRWAPVELVVKSPHLLISAPAVFGQSQSKYQQVVDLDATYWLHPQGFLDYPSLHAGIVVSH